MSTVPLSSAQRKEILQRYARRAHGASSVQSSARTPDGQCLLHTGRALDSSLNAPHSRIEAFRDGECYYSHTADSSVRYHNPVVRDDGRVGWVVRDDGEERALVEVPLWNGLVPYPHTLFTLGATMTPSSLAPDGHTLLLTSGSDVFAWDTRPGLGQRFSRVFDPRAGLTPLMSTCQPIAGVDMLSDGSLLTYPAERGRHACQIARPGATAAAVDLPLRMLSPDRYREKVRRHLRFLDSDEACDRFLAHASSIVDENGNAAEVEFSPVSNGVRALVVRDRQRSTADVYTWDESRLTRCATVHDVHVLRRPTATKSPVMLSERGGLIYIAEGPHAPRDASAPWQTRVIEVDSGRSAIVPGMSSFIFDAHQHGFAQNQDESRVAFSRDGEGQTQEIWVYDRPTASVEKRGELRDWTPGSSQFLRLAWTQDGQHIVAGYLQPNPSGYTVEILGIDGFHVTIPSLERYGVSDGVLTVALGSRSYTLPGDLTALDRDTWFAHFFEAIALGGPVEPGTASGAPAPAGEPATVAQDGDYVIIGGVRVPVRHLSDAGSASDAAGPTVSDKQT